MEAALRAAIPGIDAKCRGNCACVTCHVRLGPAWRAVVGTPGVMEESMLDFADGAGPESRLACQVRVEEGCDGLEVHVPCEQRTLGI
jgi:2Fe-2S ferredoxin